MRPLNTFDNRDVINIVLNDKKLSLVKIEPKPFLRVVRTGVELIPLL